MKLLTTDLNNATKLITISRTQYIQARLGTSVYIEHHQKEGWSKPLPIYLCRCSKHGYYLNYPQTRKQIIFCKKCDIEFFELIEKLNKLRGLPK